MSRKAALHLSQTTSDAHDLTQNMATLSHRTEAAPAENPYRLNMFTESSLINATNNYHKLDKQQNMQENKAFALTALNNLKQSQRNAVYATQIEYGTHTLSAAELQQSIKDRNGSSAFTTLD